MTLLLAVGGSLCLLLVGLAVGRYYAPDRRPVRRSAREGRAYARGLVHLLAGESAAAINELTSAVKHNSNTVEGYFALGALFRERGEHERAVRVHQTLLMRRDIDKATRVRSHLQLALDFKAAGLLDRATKALAWVVAHDRGNIEALRELGGLHQQLGAWDEAAAVYQRLSKLGGEDCKETNAHLLAQMAHQALERGELAQARKLLRQAVSLRPDSPHVLFVLGEHQRRSGRHSGALDAWSKALRRKPDLISFFFARLEQVLFELHRVEKLAELLTDLIAQYPHNAHLRLALARYDARTDPQNAARALATLSEDYPNLLPARRQAAELVLRQGDPAAIRASLAELIAAIGDAERGYRCGPCGHAAAEMFWRCPRCGLWDSARVMWGRRSTERTVPSPLPPGSAA